MSWAECRETQLSAVFLAGEYALKVKKPVCTAFVDFTSREARDLACREEVRLNSRLSPDVYLGVVRLGGGTPGAGEPAVVMRRLSEEDQLVRLLDARDPTLAGVLRAVARAIASFHADCAVDSRRSSAGAWAGVRVAWQRECDQIDRLGDVVAELPVRRLIRRLGVSYLDGRRLLLDARADAGRVREGHGDLRCDHIFCTSGGVRIIDCVDFDRDLRTADVLSDLAFLAMDLERLGHVELSFRLLESYGEFTAETYPRSLLHFYIAYRAVVRAKLAALRTGQEGPTDPGVAGYLALAVAHLRASVPFVACVGGLPGAGKTTLSEAFAASADAVHLSSDEIRHGLHPTRDPARDSEAWETGDYSPAATDEVYRILLDRAATALAGGWSVVLDASWRDPVQRARAADLAWRTGALLVGAMCRVDDGTSYRRLARARGGYSQAGGKVRASMTSAFAEWPEAHHIDTSGDVKVAVSHLDAAVAHDRERVTDPAADLVRPSA